MHLYTDTDFHQNSVSRGNNSVVFREIQLINRKSLFRITKTSGVYTVKGKAIPITGRGVPQGCETSRLPHFLDNRLIDGVEVVKLMHRPPFNPKKFSSTRNVFNSAFHCVTEFKVLRSET
jgi:hypothetical protein